MFRSLLTICLLTAFCRQSAAAITSQPVDDAAILYVQAGNIAEANMNAGIYSPASSNMLNIPNPPMPAEWITMEKADFAANAQIRELMHQARAINQATWPILKKSAGLSIPELISRCRQ